MATIQKTRMQRGVRKSMTSALFVLALGGASSVHATSDTQPPVVGPQAPPPQGMLTVYSERYVMVDADVPVVSRRPGSSPLIPVTWVRQQTRHFGRAGVSDCTSSRLTSCSSSLRLRRKLRICCCSSALKLFLFHLSLTRIKTAKTNCTRLRASCRCGITLVRRRSSTNARSAKFDVRT